MNKRKLSFAENAVNQSGFHTLSVGQQAVGQTSSTSVNRPSENALRRKQQDKEIQTMTTTQVWSTVAFGLGLVFVGFVVLDKSPAEVPPAPIAHIGTDEVPVHSVDDIGKLSGEFKLIRLPDSHDYWFYNRRNRDRGFAALAHSPECQKCLSKPEL